MNQLVNRAEAEMVASIEASDTAYAHSQRIVIGFAVVSIALALLLGFGISWSIIGPVQQMDERFQQIASGDFSRHVDVSNRDELGTLATNLNRMSDELGRLYEQIEARNGVRDLLGFERARELAMLSAPEIAQAAQQFGQEDDITVVSVTRVPVPAYVA